MDVARTPEERFRDRPDFPFTPRYREIVDPDGTRLRLAAIDEGPRDAPPILLLHGEPSWSFLYRHVIARLAAAGHRVVAPDLIGFGRSDKPTRPQDYTYERHVRWMSDWLLATDLRNVTLFGQNWGGLVGLRLVAAYPDRFARVVVANSGLPTGEGSTDAFQRWLEFSQTTPVLPIGDIIGMGCLRALSPAEKAAYEAPFPDETLKAGARRFPALVPVTPAHPSVAENKAAWKMLESFTKPFLTAFSDSDPVTRGGERIFQERVPGARGRSHPTIAGAGHFLQEDRPGEIADLLHRFIGETS